MSKFTEMWQRIKHSRRLADSLYQTRIDLDKAHEAAENAQAEIQKLERRVVRLTQRLRAAKEDEVAGSSAPLPAVKLWEVVK